MLLQQYNRLTFIHIMEKMTFGSHFSQVCLIMSQSRTLTTSFFGFCEVIQAPRSRAVDLDCRQQQCRNTILQSSSDVINSIQFMSPFR